MTIFRLKSLLQAFVVCFLCFTLSTYAAENADAYDSTGKPIRLNELKGKWVVVNYWAEWCPHCIKEMPDLEALSKRYQDKLVILGVNYDHVSNDELRQLSKKFGVTYAMLSQFPIEKFGIDDVSMLPTTFIISPNGRLKKTLFGPQTSDDLAKMMQLKN